MKKILILLPLFLLLMGCSAEYTVTFNDKNFKDTTFIYDTKDVFKNKTSTEAGIQQVSDALYTFEKYQQNAPTHKFIQRKEMVGYKYTSSFDLDEYEAYPSLVGQCYEHFDILPNEDDKTIHFKSSARFTCFQTYPELTDVTIHFQTDYKVKNHNADSVDGHTYTWNIQKGSEIKPIYISVQYDEVIKEKKKSNFNLSFLLIPLLLVGIGLFIYFFIRNRKQKDAF